MKHYSFLGLRGQHYLPLALLLVACGGGDDDDAPQSCTGDADCISDNPCQVGACGADGLCAFEAAPDGPAPEQVEGDCRTASCTDGRPNYTDDDSDVADDDEPCTEDFCQDGVARHTVSENGSSCSVGSGSGTCQQGACLVLCVEGNAATQCDDEDPCTTDLCAPCDAPACRGLGQCVHEPGDGPGPDDGNECTVDYCQAGEPVHEPAPASTPCSNGGTVCNAAGDCVQCVTDADCEGVDVSTCYVAVCEDDRCEEEAAPEGTVPETADTPGDCHRPICSGTGSLTTEVDDEDVPDDMNPCTEDACMDGNPMYTAVDPGSSCGDGSEICNDYALCCTPFVHDGASDMLALRMAYVSQFSRTSYLATFDPSDGSTVDLAALDVDPEQIAHDPESGRIFYMTSSGLGLLADCGDTELEGVSIAPPDTATELSVPSTLAYDTNARSVLLASMGGAGVLYAYDPASGEWSERGGLDNFDAIAASYFSETDKLYMASSSWTTSVRRFTPAGATEGDVTLTPNLTGSGGTTHVQMRESGSSLYYILQGHDGFSSYYGFVQVDPSDGASTAIYPPP